MVAGVSNRTNDPNHSDNLDPIHSSGISLKDGEIAIFKCHIPYCNFVTRAGKVLSFVGGEFRTKIRSEIDELKHEIDNGHEKIHSWVVATEASLDPMASLKEHFYKQFQAEQAAAALNPDRDMGTSDQTQKLNVATSKDVSEAAAGGSGSQLAKQISNIKIGPTGTAA